jgi:hypothetical protein
VPCWLCCQPGSPVPAATVNSVCCRCLSVSCAVGMLALPQWQVVKLACHGCMEEFPCTGFMHNVQVVPVKMISILMPCVRCCCLAGADVACGHAGGLQEHV